MARQPTYEIEVTGSPGVCVPRAALLKALRTALKRHGVRAARLSVAVVNDAVIRRLHRKHMNQRGTTDVLSFDLREPPAPDESIDGELVLCADEARRQAARRGHSMTDELCLYAVHGALHLLGLDDATLRAAAEMYAEEEAILAALGRSGVRGSAARRARAERR